MLSEIKDTTAGEAPTSDNQCSTPVGKAPYDVLESVGWYALKVFHNKVNALEESLGGVKGCECYVPREQVKVVGDDGRKVVRERAAVAGLLFVRIAGDTMAAVKERISGSAMFYTKADGMPARIPDGEMTMFRLVSSSRCDGLEYLPGDTADYAVGQRVRVLEGPLRGAEGYIRRIHGNRRLVVSINGICAVATSYIPACFLEKI